MLTQDIINKLMVSEGKKYKKQHITNRNLQNSYNKEVINELRELLTELV